MSHETIITPSTTERVIAEVNEMMTSCHYNFDQEEESIRLSAERFCGEIKQLIDGPLDISGKPLAELLLMTIEVQSKCFLSTLPSHEWILTPFEHALSEMREKILAVFEEVPASPPPSPSGSDPVSADASAPATALELPDDLRSLLNEYDQIGAGDDSSPPPPARPDSEPLPPADSAPATALELPDDLRSLLEGYDQIGTDPDPTLGPPAPETAASPETPPTTMISLPLIPAPVMPVMTSVAVVRPADIFAQASIIDQLRGNPDLAEALRHHLPGVDPEAFARVAALLLPSHFPEKPESPAPHRSSKPRARAPQQIALVDVDRHLITQIVHSEIKKRLNACAQESERILFREECAGIVLDETEKTHKIEMFIEKHFPTLFSSALQEIQPLYPDWDGDSIRKPIMDDLLDYAHQCLYEVTQTESEEILRETDTSTVLTHEQQVAWEGHTRWLKEVADACPLGRTRKFSELMLVHELSAMLSAGDMLIQAPAIVEMVIQQIGLIREAYELEHGRGGAPIALRPKSMTPGTLRARLESLLRCLPKAFNNSYLNRVDAKIRTLQKNLVDVRQRRQALAGRLRDARMSDDSSENPDELQMTLDALDRELRRLGNMEKAINEKLKNI